MTGIGCLRAEALIGRRAVGLSTADALRLEEHLAGCEACSAQAKLFAQLRSAAAAMDTTLTSLERERAISSALSRAQRGSISRLRVRSWRPAALALAAAALLGLGLRVVWFVRQSPELAGASRVLPGAVNAHADRVLAGAVQMQGRALAAGAALENDATLQSATGAKLALAQAQVELRPGTRARWGKLDHTLRLEAGSVVADVDPSAHARFVVQTARFAVVVLGTQFEVSLDAVNVTRGRVQVLAADGRLLAQVGAGERFVAGADKSADNADTGSTDASNVAHADTTPPRTASAASDAAPAVAQPRHAHGDATALLAEARAQLAHKQVGSAEKLIDAALASPLPPSARAEALTLRAECALVEGDKAAAVGAYLRVANTYARLTAGENALFAAARIEAERNERSAATRSLTRYLERYPHGRFVAEARTRLHELTLPVNHAP